MLPPRFPISKELAVILGALLLAAVHQSGRRLVGGTRG